MSHSVQSLREEVEQAFGGRPHPGDDRIAAVRPECPDYEGNVAAAFFRGKDWREVDWASLVRDYPAPHGAALAFMLPEGFCYFLPVFLRAALDGDPDALESVVVQLTRAGTSAPDGVRERCESILASLAPEERLAIVHVLERLAGSAEAGGAPADRLHEAIESLRAEAGRTPGRGQADVR